MFHFGQCIYRKLQKLGLSGDYQNDINFKVFIKCVSSLAFVPQDSVGNEFEKLCDGAIKFSNPNLDLFLQYLEKNFIKSKKFPIESWNAYHRTINNEKLASNSAEIFNRHFYSRFDQSHSGLVTFISNLKDQQSLIEQDIMYQLIYPNLHAPNRKTE